MSEHISKIYQLDFALHPVAQTSTYKHEAGVGTSVLLEKFRFAASDNTVQMAHSVHQEMKGCPVAEGTETAQSSSLKASADCTRGALVKTDSLSSADADNQQISVIEVVNVKMHGEKGPVHEKMPILRV